MFLQPRGQSCALLQSFFYELSESHLLLLPGEQFCPALCLLKLGLWPAETGLLVLPSPSESQILWGTLALELILRESSLGQWIKCSPKCVFQMFEDRGVTLRDPPLVLGWKERPAQVLLKGLMVREELAYSAES